MKEFDEMVEVMHRLRKECPWDRKQTLETLRSYLLEEAYECVSAIDEISSEGYDNVIEELGDVQLQVLFQSEILSEKLGRPILAEVLSTLKEKLVRRHPHIFGDQKNLDADQVINQWNQIKAQEKGGERKSLLDGIAKALTALQRAEKLGKRSQEVSFDWNNSSEVWKHLESEIVELKEARSREEKEHELGDILFCLAQWARHEKIDPEVALAGTNARFQRRFEKMEEFAKVSTQDFKSLSLSEKEKLWQQAKQSEKTPSQEI